MTDMTGLLYATGVHELKPRATWRRPLAHMLITEDPNLISDAEPVHDRASDSLLSADYQSGRRIQKNRWRRLAEVEHVEDRPCHGVKRLVS